MSDGTWEDPSAGDKLLVIVTADGEKPYRAWMRACGQVAYLDARQRKCWPVLAELGVPLAKLPRAYVLPNRDAGWLRNPRPVSRIWAISMDGVLES